MQIFAGGKGGDKQAGSDCIYRGCEYTVINDGVLNIDISEPKGTEIIVKAAAKTESDVFDETSITVESPGCVVWRRMLLSGCLFHKQLWHSSGYVGTTAIRLM